MDAQQIAIAKRCLNSAYDNSMSFPEVVGALIAAGFEGYVVDFRRHATTYFLPNGDSVVLENPPSAGAVEARFDAATISAQIAWAQANPPDCSYPAFCEKVKAAGCAGYIVSFLGKRVVYFGRTAELHIEHFPDSN